MAAPPGPQSYIIIPAADQSSEFEPSMSWKISQKEEIERNSEQMRVQAQDSMEEKLRASVVTKQQREDLENEYKAFVRSIRATAQSQFYAVLSEERQTLQILGVSQLRISDEFIKEQQSILATIQQKKDQEGNIHDTDDAELVPIPDVATPASIPSSSWSAPHILPSRPYPPPVHSQERARVSSSTSTSSRQALDLSSPPSSSGRGYNDYSGEAAAPLRARPSLSRQSTDTAQSMPPPQTPPALSSSADSPLSGTPPVGTRSSSANWTTYTRPNAASASSSDKSASIRKDGERNEYSNHSDNASPSRRTSVVIGNSGDTSSWRGSMSEREPTSRRPSLLEREAPQLSSSPKQRAEFWKPSVTRDEDAALSKPHATPRRNSTASTRSIGSSHSYKPPSVGPIRTQANPEEDSAFEAEVTVNPIEEEPALYIGKGKGVDRGPAPRAVSAQSSRGDPTGSHLTQYFTRHQTQTHSDPYDRRADSRVSNEERYPSPRAYHAQDDTPSRPRTLSREDHNRSRSGESDRYLYGNPRERDGQRLQEGRSSRHFVSPINQVPQTQDDVDYSLTRGVPMSASRSPDNSRLDSLRDRAKQRLPNHHFQADRRDPDPTAYAHYHQSINTADEYAMDDRVHSRRAGEYMQDDRGDHASSPHSPYHDAYKAASSPIAVPNVASRNAAYAPWHDSPSKSPEARVLDRTRSQASLRYRSSKPNLHSQHFPHQGGGGRSFEEDIDYGMEYQPALEEDYHLPQIRERNEEKIRLSNYRKQAEDVQRREEELRKREADLKRREQEAELERKHEQIRRAEEEIRRREDELARKEREANEKAEREAAEKALREAEARELEKQRAAREAHARAARLHATNTQTLSRARSTKALRTEDVVRRVSVHPPSKASHARHGRTFSSEESSGLETDVMQDSADDESLPGSEDMPISIGEEDDDEEEQETVFRSSHRVSSGARTSTDRYEGNRAALSKHHDKERAPPRKREEEQAQGSRRIEQPRKKRTEMDGGSRVEDDIHGEQLQKDRKAQRARAKREQEVAKEAHRKQEEEEVRRKQEEDTRRQQNEEDARRKREVEDRRRKDEDARRKKEEEARRKREEDARRKKEEDARRKKEEDARRKKEEDARRKREEEDRLKREEEDRLKQEEEERRKQEEEERRQEEEEARRLEEEEALRLEAEEALRLEAEETRQREEEEARRLEEEEARQREEEEIRQREEEETRRREEEEETRRKQEEAVRRRQEEAEALRKKKKEEADQRKKKKEEAEKRKKQREEERKRQEEEELSKRQAEEEEQERKLEEQARIKKEQEEQERKASEEQTRLEEEERKAEQLEQQREAELEMEKQAASAKRDKAAKKAARKLAKQQKLAEEEAHHQLASEVDSSSNTELPESSADLDENILQKCGEDEEGHEPAIGDPEEELRQQAEVERLEAEKRAEAAAERARKKQAEAENLRQMEERFRKQQQQLTERANDHLERQRKQQEEAERVKKEEEERRRRRQEEAERRRQEEVERRRQEEAAVKEQQEEADRLYAEQLQMNEEQGLPHSSPNPQQQRRAQRSGSTTSNTSSWSDWTNASSSTWTSAPGSSRTHGSSSSWGSAAGSAWGSTASGQTRKPSLSSPISPEIEWERRQAEHLRKQQEQFKREQERLTREHHMNRNRIFTRDEVHHIVAENEQRRSKLLTLDVIRWCDLPWPMLRKPETPEDITLGGIDGYVRNPYHPEQGRSERDRVKDHIKYWHPDRFETKLLPRVPEEEQEMVKTGAGIVARTLNELMSSVG